MVQNEFRELIQAGLGRAIVYARDNDISVFRDIILDACLHCYSIDPQSEGTRAGYMLDLVQLTPDRAFYSDKVLKALATSEDDWDAVQRFHFATCMALEGNDRARQAIHDNFEPGPKHGEAIAIDLLKLDGPKGLVAAARSIGQLLLTAPDEVDEGWLWSVAIDMFGEQNALTVLHQAAPADARIEAYRRTVMGRAANTDRGTHWRALSTLGYLELSQKLFDLQAFQISGWGKQASAEELEYAARGLAEASDAEIQIQHLRIFSRRAYPLDPSLLLELAASDDERLAYAAAIASAKITHPDIRHLAFRLVADQRPGRQVSISMLGQNFEPNDHDVILNWFETEPDRQIRHGMERGLIAFWELHRDATSEARMLRSVYRKGPCSFCREAAVKRLIELDALPAACAPSVPVTQTTTSES